MPYYYPNEVLYPDYTAFAQPADFNAPYQVYNLEKPVDNTDFYLCKPTSTCPTIQTKQTNHFIFLDAPQSPQFEPAETGSSSKHDPEIEDILRSNEEVWQAYQTGRFRVVTRFEDGHKKIILKEKASTDIDDSEFIVRRYKVLVSSPRNSRVKDDHVLLVSFSQRSLPPSQRPPQQQQQLEIEPGTRASNQNLMAFRRTDSQMLTGPGTELINRIVNGEEDSFEILDDMGHYEPAYEIQTSPSKVSSRDNKLSREFYEKTATESSRSSNTTSSNSQSEAEDYIDEIINKIKGQVSRQVNA